MRDSKDLEAALSATADRLTRGSGAAAVHDFKNEIGMITSSSDDQIRRYAGGEVQLVAPAVFESKQPDGDPVTIGKGREGLIAVYPDGLVFVRGIAFGARESKAYAATDVAVERVTTVLNGAEVPGVRIVGRHGKPKLALAIAHGQEPGNAAEQAAVCDEIVGLLAR
jgi:hypothetical protein